MRAGGTRSNDPLGDRDRWVRWRAGRLLHAGFSLELAQSLAGEDRVDLHQLLELVDRGCPPPLAARILAPLDDEREPA